MQIIQYLRFECHAACVSEAVHVNSAVKPCTLIATALQCLQDARPLDIYADQGTQAS